MCIACSASRFHFVLVVFLISLSRHCESLPVNILDRFSTRRLAEELEHDDHEHDVSEEHEDHKVAWTEIQEFLTFSDEEYITETKLNSLLKMLNEMKEAQAAQEDAHAGHAHGDETDHTDHADEEDHADHADEEDHADHADEEDHADHADEEDHADHADEEDHADHADEEDHADHADDEDHADHAEHTMSVSADWLIDEFGNTTSRTLNSEQFEKASVAIISCMVREECMFDIIEENVAGEKSNQYLDLKGIMIVVVFFLGILGGLVPLACYNLMNKDTFAWGMSLANAFSGGVFIGSAFLHLLPHVVEEAEHADLDTDFPVPYSLVIVGYFLIFAVEKIIFHAHHHGTDDPHNLTAAGAKNGIPKVFMTSDESGAAKGYSGVFSKFVHLQSSLLLFGAISCHAVIAGVALGIQSDKEGLLLIFWAIIAHKSVVALSLGVKFLTDGASTLQAMVMLTAFSLVTPIGTLIGMAVDNENSTTSMILNGLSAGTFLYIGASEVVVDEFELSATAYLSSEKFNAENDPNISRQNAHAKDRRIKFLCMFCGVGVIALASLTPSHEH